MGNVASLLHLYTDKDLLININVNTSQPKHSQSDSSCTCLNLEQTPKTAFVLWDNLSFKFIFLVI